MRTVKEDHAGYRQGLVIVNTGDGKGKTTAALGLAMRAIGHGMRARFIQFIKSAETGEHLMARELGDALTIDAMGSGFVIGEWQPEDIAAAREAWQAACDTVDAGDCELLVLDEITYVVNAGVVSEEEVTDLLSRKPDSMTIVLTGREASDGLIAAADLVTEMRCVKHPYERGVKAQKGMEF